MQVQVFMTSARDLKNVNWRNGLLKAYAVVWIDSSGKCSTKIDLDNGVNPVWNEKFTIPLTSTSHPETAILYIDVVHANASPNTKPLIGSVKLPLSAVLKEARTNGKVPRSLDLKRPSGRPQGILELKIGVKDQIISPRDQHVQHVPQQVLNRPIRPQGLPQAQVHALGQPQIFQQRPQRSTAPVHGQPIYRPVRPSARQEICNVAMNMALGRNPMQGMMRRMAAQYQHAVQANNNNNAAFLNTAGNNNGQVNVDTGNNDNGAYVDGQFTDGGFDDGSGYNMGGFDTSGLGDGSGIDIMGGSGFDVNGLMGGSGLDFAGLMGDGGVDLGSLFN